MDESGDLGFDFSKSKTTKNFIITILFVKDIKRIHKIVKKILLLGQRCLVYVEVKTPNEERCLQAVDFISWAIFRKHEYKDSQYFNLIKNIIVEEGWLYGNK